MEYAAQLAAVEFERSILGALLLDNECRASGILRPDDFSLDSHRRIFRAITELVAAEQPCDPLSVGEMLRSHGELEQIGGSAYISELTTGCVPESFPHHARILREKAGKRHALHCADNLMRQAMNGCGIADLRARCAEISEQLADYEPSGEDVTSLLPDPLELSQDPEPWIIPAFILKGGITALTAAPGDGKTWLGLAIARAVALAGEFLGRKCEPCEVVILDRENPKYVIQKRWRTLFGGPIKGRVALWANWSGLGEVPTIGDPRLRELARPGRLIIIDTFSSFSCVKDENDAAQVAPVMQELRRMADAGAAILLLHHRGKNDLLQYRGSSAIAAGLDVICSIARDRDTQLLTLHGFKTRDTEFTWR